MNNPKPWQFFGFGGTNPKGGPFPSDAPNFDRRRDSISVARSTASTNYHILVDTPHLVVARHKMSARLIVYIHDDLIDA